MRALAIDTVTQICSVALQIDDEVFSQHALSPNQHSNIVLDMIDHVLKQANISLTELDLIICDVGPGSFTGIRIGMGVAQGLAYAAKLPLLGLDALSVLAQGVKNKNDWPIVAAMDARMQQIYWATFKQRADKLVLEGQLHLSSPENIANVGEPVLAVGDGWGVYGEILQSKNEIAQAENQSFPMATSALELGRMQSKSSWVEAGELLPVYLRNDVAKVSKKPNPANIAR